MEGPITPFLCLLLIVGWVVAAARPTDSSATSLPPPRLQNKDPVAAYLFRERRKAAAKSQQEKPEQQDVVQSLAAKGDPNAAALQLIETHGWAGPGRPCKRTSLADIPNFQWRQEQYAQFQQQSRVAQKTANVLNNFFLKVPPNETDFLPNELFLYSLVKANVECEPGISSSSIALYRDDRFEQSGLFIPYAFRRSGGVGTRSLEASDVDRWPGNDWFWGQASKNYSDVFYRKFGASYYAILGAIANGSADLLVGDDDGLWTAPYFDCDLTSNWHVTYASPFFSHHGNEIVFRGVATVSVDLSQVDINQCDEHQSMFASTHHCDKTSTQCVPVHGMGFRRGAYRCYCKVGYYYPSDARASGMDYFTGSEVEEAHIASVLEGTTNSQSALQLPEDFRCLPCRLGCETCRGDSPCFVEYDMILRSLVLGFQSFCSTIVVILAVVVFRLRKSKMFASAMWVMLETILFGSLLLYQTVIIRYFEPNFLTCMLEPWFRGLGFAICYGAITLKIYRILAEFQTRKAHRVCVRDKDLLKYLMGIILVVIGYLSAWTAVIIDNMTEGYSVVAHGRTSVGLKYVMCRALWWDYVTEVGELMFLLFGVFLTYKVRNATSDCFREKSSLAWSVYIEALVSLLMYTIRHVVWSNLQPDYVYLLYFLRCQCTVTIILFLIFGPKLWYHHRPPEPLDYQQGRHLSSCGDVRDNLPETMKLHEAITSNGEVDFSDINLSDMDPEDIRTELRRVYTQLQILRNITMRKGNPHISRRRGGRKGTHRRFSLQTFHHRHKHYHEHEHEVTEVSKTPEESTASADGTPADGPSSRPDDYPSTSTVTFREGPK